MTNKIKAIIFDMDGTLVNSLPIWTRVDKRLIELQGCIPSETIKEDREECLKKNNVGNVYLKYCEFLKEKYELLESPEEINVLRGEIAEVLCKEDIELKDGADRVLKDLKEFGYMIGLATVSSSKFVSLYINDNENIRNKCDLNDIFGEMILTKDHVYKKKPDPEVYIKMMEKMNVKPEECIIVEDSVEGVTAARRAGGDEVTIIAIHDDEHSDINREEIKEISDFYLESYDRFTDIIKEVESYEQSI